MTIEHGSEDFAAHRTEIDHEELDHHAHHQGEQGDNQIGQVFIPIAGATHEVKKRGRIIKPTNLRKAAGWVGIELRQMRRLEEIVTKNLEANRTVRASAILGGIILTIGAGLEIDHKHGNHASTYVKWMKKGLTELGKIPHPHKGKDRG